MILCVKNPKNSTKKMLEIINKSSKVAEYKINMQTQWFFYTQEQTTQKRN